MTTPKWKGWFELFKAAAVDWMDDKAPRLGAALAFYTIFSLAPLLTIIIALASLWYSENASAQVFLQLASVIGTDSAKSLQDMLVQPPGEKSSGILTTVSAALMLLVGATGIFVQLQDALNEIWEVKPKPGQGIMGFIRHRLLSLAMVLALAFLLVVSLAVSTALAAVGKYFSPMFGNAQWLFEILNNAASFGVFAVLFATLFKYVPDAKVAWRDVWVGAVFTATLFVVGKFGLGAYLGKSSVVSTYKAAGALLIVLLWVYYSAQIVFYGAELTQAYARRRGHEVEPSEHAVVDKAVSLAHDSEHGKKAEEKGRIAGRPAMGIGSATPWNVEPLASRSKHAVALWTCAALIPTLVFMVMRPKRFVAKH
jgi:membrane protein